MPNPTNKIWLKHYTQGVPEKLEYKNLFLPDFLKQAKKEIGSKDALIFQGYKMSYTELSDMVDKFATYLDSIGIKKGDVVAILLPNLIPCVVAFYSILKVGAIAVMNNPLYSDRELEYQFVDSGAKALITLDLLSNRMIDLRKKTKIKEIIYTSIGDYLPFPKNLLFPLVAKKKKLAADVKEAENVFKWKEVIKKSNANPPDVKLNFDDEAIYQYTGGTTGISKGAILSHGNLTKQVQQIIAWFPKFEKAGETMLGALPFFHVFGLSTSMNFSIAMGWTNVLVAKPHPEALIEAITKFKVTFAPLVPTMYIGLLEHPKIDKADISSIKGCFSGSAPLPTNIIKEFEKKTGAKIAEGYGLTETSPVTHVNPFSEGKTVVGSIGIPISDTETKIVDLKDGTTELGVGEIGELLVKGPQVMKGYLNKKEETANILKDGWFYTGDIAKMDEEGYFYIVGRKKNMIISGGYNIYPRDIEEVLFDHPKILEVAAIGKEDAKLGESIKVFIVLKEGEVATEEEILNFCKDNLAKYKIPKGIKFMKELPKTNVGKVLKRELKDL